MEEEVTTNATSDSGSDLEWWLAEKEKARRELDNAREKAELILLQLRQAQAELKRQLTDCQHLSGELAKCQEENKRLEADSLILATEADELKAVVEEARKESAYIEAAANKNVHQLKAVQVQLGQAQSKITWLRGQRDMLLRLLRSMLNTLSRSMELNSRLGVCASQNRKRSNQDAMRTQSRQPR